VRNSAANIELVRSICKKWRFPRVPFPAPGAGRDGALEFWRPIHKILSMSTNAIITVCIVIAALCCMLLPELALGLHEPANVSIWACATTAVLSLVVIKRSQ